MISVGTSSDEGSVDPSTVKAMKELISQLTSALQAAEARERRTDDQHAGMNAQLDRLLASGGIFDSTCPGDAHKSHPGPSLARRRSQP
ncbi:hypothetical protein RND71_026599 [Anisodus tanguticus]|uniref:Uncharacterized protein n=1 Tax=Anisodus tanguticus TaxID=243964 RepID=A0AAE1RMP6_9SOLA|nr:hypothetical protein RND71_026599 [Anisodus tanguticus]